MSPYQTISGAPRNIFMTNSVPAPVATPNIFMTNSPQVQSMTPSSPPQPFAPRVTSTPNIFATNQAVPAQGNIFASAASAYASTQPAPQMGSPLPANIFTTSASTTRSTANPFI